MSNGHWLRPYAAKAFVQYEWSASEISIFVTFRFSMDETVRPVHSLWLVEIDDVLKSVSTSQWLDAYTLLLTIASILSAPDSVTLEYNGPDSALQTTWEKQWEPWGAITAELLITVTGLTGTYNFNGVASGEILTMTFTGGILTGVTTVP